LPLIDFSVLVVVVVVPAVVVAPAVATVLHVSLPSKEPFATKTHPTCLSSVRVQVEALLEFEKVADKVISEQVSEESSRWITIFLVCSSSPQVAKIDAGGFVITRSSLDDDDDDVGGGGTNLSNFVTTFDRCFFPPPRNEGFS
jgi:hypothetical protein